MNIQLQLQSTKTVFLQLAPLTDDFNEIFESRNEVSNENRFEFGLDVQFSEEYKDEFVVVIHAELSRKDSFTLQSVFSAEFKARGGELDEKFKESKFPYINAPAIAYPFFRAMIANTLVNSGLEPYYLASVNFERLYNEKFK